MPLVPVLSRLERHGALVDGALLAVQSRELGEPVSYTHLTLPTSDLV